MNITSLLITIAGIIIIIALYIMSKIARSKLPSKKQTSIIPNLKDDDGGKFTSVLDDIPARDGSTPHVDATAIEENIPEQALEEDDDYNIEDEPGPPKVTIKPAIETTQHILFISGKDENGLDGNVVQQALKGHGLVFGEMDIYHYMVNLEEDTGMTSLFRVANGVSPWTLIDTDLLNKRLAGLSIVMLTPSKINDKKAMNTFITVTENLCKSVNGILKNDKQQLLTEKDKTQLMASVK